MNLIDKDALVAELERLYELEYIKSDNLSIGKKMILRHILSFLGTIEVKEVGLEPNSFDATVCKIGNTYLKEMDRDAIVKALEPYKDGDKVKVIIKAHKGK
jgi:hypothetical protein